MHQNSPKIGPKPIQNAILFLIGSWIRFKSILVPNWLQLGSRNLPKSSQVGVKIDPNWSIVLEAIFGWMLGTFSTVLQHMLRLPKYVKIVKTLYENRIFAIFVVSLLSRLRNEFWMDFEYMFA